MRKVTACLVLTTCLLTAYTATAAIPWGGRAGLSVSPDQFAIGAHAWVVEPIPAWYIQPTLEFGFGDNVTTFAINGDFLYTFPKIQSDWAIYAGAGLGFANYSFDVPAGVDGSASEFGLNIFGGANRILKNNHRVGAELRVGIGDLPDLKIMGMYTLW
jgi:hypothetical protein